MLTPGELLKSDIVANSTMNRGRGLRGVNSYAKELRFDPADWLTTRARERGSAAWCDFCCGEGRALYEARDLFDRLNAPRISITGLDLFAGAQPVEGIDFVSGDILDYSPPQPIDLITCVHGLHYLGDKLRILEYAYAHLADGGVFVGHLDAANIRLPERTTLAALLKRARADGVAIELKNHLLTMTKSSAPLEFGLTYVGATMSERPNYTHITVIDSWYAPHRP